MVDIVKSATGAAGGAGSARLVPPPNPQQWVADQQRVNVLSPDLSTTIGRGRVAAYIPESVAVRLGNGNLVNVPVARVAPLDIADRQSELDQAIIDVLGGGVLARARYNALLAAGYTVNPPAGT